jgi:hypothetical protein
MVKPILCVRTVRGAAIALVAALALALPCGAGAATTIGSTLARPAEESTCGPNSTFLNAALATPGILTAPYDGVVVRWRASLYEPGGSYEYRLRVLQPSTNNPRSYRFIASGPKQLLPKAGINVIDLPQPLPISAGDVIAYDCPTNAPAPAAGENILFPGNSTAYFNPIPIDGKVAESSSPGAPAYGEEELINADIVGVPALAGPTQVRVGIDGRYGVIVTGEHLGDLTSATIGGASTTDITAFSETEARVTAPAHAPGEADLTVTNAAGTSNVLTGAVEFVGPPKITGLSQKRKAWKRSKGTVFAFKLNEAATVRMEFIRARSSRGTLQFAAKAGRNRVVFKGRAGKRKLAPGRYKAMIAATNAVSETSVAKFLSFKILR